jgi:Flp pilus assembly protein TadD
VLAVGLGVGLAVGLLGTVEGVLRLTGAGGSHLYDDPFVGFAPGSALFAEHRLPDGRRVFTTRPEKLAFFNEQTFPAEKPPGGYRVFSVGGSTTYGSPYDDGVSFSRWLERYLRAADPSRHWEVVNAGAQSYASYRVVLLMRELVRYEPDLFIVYSGHNEFLEERTYSDIIDRDPRLRRLEMRLSRLRLAAVARRAWQRATGPAPEAAPATLAPEVATRLDGWTGVEAYERDDELARAILEHYAFNLHQMVDLARDHGAAIVFVDPVENLKDFSPFKSQHSPGLDEGARRRSAELLARGRELLAQGDAASALPVLEAASALDPRHAEVRFRLGRALLALGRTAAARAALVSAKEEDVAPLRALEGIHRALHRVAAERGVPLVDLPALLAGESRQRFGHDLLGNEVLLDHVHPDVPVHSLVAERLLAHLVEAGVARPGPEWDEAERRRIYAAVVAGLDPEDYARRDLALAKVLGWAGKLEEAEPPLERAARVLRDEPEVFLNQGILYQRTGRREAALDALDRAVALAPRWELVRFNRGVTLASLGRVDEAVAELEEAVRLRPDYPEAHHNLAVLYRELGDLQRAEEELSRLGERAADTAEARRAQALLLRDQGRLEEARDLFRQVLAERPRDSRARAGLGITLARLGELAAAEGELGAAVELAPDDPEAWYDLGVVASQQGDEERAESAWRRAVALAPRHARALNNLGILLASRGSLAEGRRLLARAVEADPGYADALFNLGVAEDGAGRPAEARRLIVRALELDPQNPRYLEALALLEGRGAIP